LFSSRICLFIRSEFPYTATGKEDVEELFEESELEAAASIGIVVFVVVVVAVIGGAHPEYSI